MKTGEFAYDVSLQVTFTEDELNIIQSCAKSHYDKYVRSVIEQGGFFYGWMNMFQASILTIRCSSRELDTCLKALEINGVLDKKYGETRKLVRDIQTAVRSIEDEWTRCNKRKIETYEEVRS